MTPFIRNSSCADNDNAPFVQRKQTKMDYTIGKNKQRKRSLKENVDPSSPRCNNAYSENAKRGDASCQKIVGDFRFLLELEFYNLAAATQTSPRKNCSTKTTNLTSHSELTRKETIAAAEKRLKPGTLLRMLFSQVDQIEEDISQEFFYRIYSKSVNLFVILSLFHTFTIQLCRMCN